MENPNEVRSIALEKVQAVVSCVQSSESDVKY
jgi:hypothetical protein